MSDVVLGGILGSFIIQIFKELGLHRLEVRAFFKDVVAVKHVAHEVAIIKVQVELLLNICVDMPSDLQHALSTLPLPDRGTLLGRIWGAAL